jgi:hypothetical protein
VDGLRRYLPFVVLLLLVGIGVGILIARNLPLSVEEIAFKRVRDECWQHLKPRTYPRAEVLLVKLRRILDWLGEFKGSDEPARIGDWCRWKIEKEMGMREKLPAPGKPPEATLPNVENLTGLTRDRIEAAFGPPSGICWGSDGGVLEDGSCGGARVWQYSFYYLPTRRLGGGPELTLVFDEKGVCILSLWDYSQ